MVKQYWKIEGYDSAKKIFEKIMPVGLLSEREVIVLLQRLYARYLDEDEIISSSLRKSASGYTPLLNAVISQGGHRSSITVGDSRFYTASVWKIDELSNDKDCP